MAKVTVALGLMLIALGIGTYLGTGRASVTALIPAFFGAPLMFLGLLAMKDSMRKHAMHVAALLGMLGFIGAARGLKDLPALMTGGELERPAAVAAQSAMAIACLLFVVLCVWSFISARRASAG